MRVDIWSDIVCPWCYIGKRRFDQALASFGGRDEVEVVHHSFELDPSFDRDRPQLLLDMLAPSTGWTRSRPGRPRRGSLRRPPRTAWATPRTGWSATPSTRTAWCTWA